jgi:hypothetical protein
VTKNGRAAMLKPVQGNLDAGRDMLVQAHRMANVP